MELTFEQFVEEAPKHLSKIFNEQNLTQECRTIATEFATTIFREQGATQENIAERCSTAVFMAMTAVANVLGRDPVIS